MGLGSCVVCNTPAKYKCTTCGNQGATCSAACSSAHKTQHTSSTHPTSPLPPVPAGPSTQPANGKLDEEGLLRDYVFLSEMTRNVTAFGRDLASASWAQQGVEDSSLITRAGPAAAAELALQKREREACRLRGGSRGRGRGGGMGPQNGLGRVQARRDFLAKQARFLRIPLLLLPNGMELAVINRSGWLRRYVPFPFGLLWLVSC